MSVAWKEKTMPDTNNKGHKGGMDHKPSGNNTTDHKSAGGKTSQGDKSGKGAQGGRAEQQTQAGRQSHKND